MKKIKSYTILNIILFINSFCSVCAKIAATKDFFSFEFCFFYGLSILILGIYALLWQQIIKKIPLNIACANKAVTIVWGMLWGMIIFKEQITTTNIIGMVVVVTGVLLMITGGEKNND